MGMAKAKTLDDIVEEIVENYHNVLAAAAQNVAVQAEKEIYEGSISILHDHYYDWKPRKRFTTRKDGGKYKNGGRKKWRRGYKRTFSLEHSFLSFTKVEQKKNEVICEIGIEYSPSALDAYVKSKNITSYIGSNKYGWVDAEWVINNFLEGKHPYTDGSSEPGTPVFYHVDPKKNLQSTGMESLLNRYAYSILPRAIIVEMINLIRG